MKFLFRRNQMNILPFPRLFLSYRSLTSAFIVIGSVIFMFFYCFYCVWIENRMFYISKIACLDITVVVRHIWLHSRYIIMYNVYYADFLCCLRRDAFFTMARASSASRRVAKTYKTMLVFLVYYYLIFHFTWAAFPSVCHDVLFYFVH